MTRRWLVAIALMLSSGCSRDKAVTNTDAPKPGMRIAYKYKAAVFDKLERFRDLNRMLNERTKPIDAQAVARYQAYIVGDLVPGDLIDILEVGPDYLKIERVRRGPDTDNAVIRGYIDRLEVSAALYRDHPDWLKEDLE